MNCEIYSFWNLLGTPYACVTLGQSLVILGIFFVLLFAFLRIIK